jgi:hypothetical protein
MQADFSVELGRDDPALELPWESDDPGVRYFDLKNDPELVRQIPEAIQHPELGQFLARINAVGSPLATAKCDAWSSMEVAPEEEIFGDRKFVSYIDLVFVSETDLCSFEKHEAFASDLCRLLSRAPEIPAAVELVIRHCHCHGEKLVDNQEAGRKDLRSRLREEDHRMTGLEAVGCTAEKEGREVKYLPGQEIECRKPQLADTGGSAIGFCLTAYVTGFGDGVHDPIRQWTIGLGLLQHAVVQLIRNA